MELQKDSHSIYHRGLLDLMNFNVRFHSFENVRSVLLLCVGKRKLIRRAKIPSIRRMKNICLNPVRGYIIAPVVIPAIIPAPMLIPSSINARALKFAEVIVPMRACRSPAIAPDPWSALPIIKPHILFDSRHSADPAVNADSPIMMVFLMPMRSPSIPKGI